MCKSLKLQDNEQNMYDRNNKKMIMKKKKTKMIDREKKTDFLIYDWHKNQTQSNQ